jgi:hypothetical protein
VPLIGRDLCHYEYIFRRPEMHGVQALVRHCFGAKAQPSTFSGQGYSYSDLGSEAVPPPVAAKTLQVRVNVLTNGFQV